MLDGSPQNVERVLVAVTDVNREMAHLTEMEIANDWAVAEGPIAAG